MTKMKGGPADSGGPVEVPEQLPILPLRNSVLFPGRSFRSTSAGARACASSRRRSRRSGRSSASSRRATRAPRIRPRATCTRSAARRASSRSSSSRRTTSRVILQGVSRIRGRRVQRSRSRSSSRACRRSRIRRRTDVELDALVMNLKDIAKRVIKLMPELPKEAGALVDSVTEPGQLADLDHVEPRHPGRREAGRPRDLRSQDAHAQGAAVPLAPARGLEGAREDQHAGPGRDGPQPARVRAAPAAQGDQGRARRARRGRRRSRRVQGEDRRRRRCRPRPRRSRSSSSSGSRCMQPSSAEYTVTRTYLEWLVELPWSISTEDKLDIQEARDILDEDHYDLEKVKKRILEYLAVRKLKSDKKGPILCLARTAGRRQDLARPLDRAARWGASSSASRSAACATRPRSAATAAPTSARCRAASSRAEEGGHQQPGLHARRDRQARARLPGRPGVGAARGARPRAEQHVQRSLPRGAVRSVAGDVHRDGERARPDPGGAQAIASRSSSCRATRATRSATSRASSWCPSSSRSTASTTSTSRSPTSAVAEVIDSYTREAGVRNLEREIGSVCRGVAVKVAEGQAKEQVRHRGRPTCRSTSGRRSSCREVAERTARAGRGDGPGVDAGRRRHPVHRSDARCRARASWSSPVSSAT